MIHHLQTRSKGDYKHRTNIVKAIECTCWVITTTGDVSGEWIKDEPSIEEIQNLMVSVSDENRTWRDWLVL